ncbi:MAG: bifunctional serine/threonine-protein kinase/formylglycine-generating enzyme family protein [Planctomycetota bacterium]
MTAPEERERDRDDARSEASFDDEALERALDGAFAPDSPESAILPPAERPMLGHAVPAVSLRDADPAGETPMLEPLGPGDVRQAGKYVIHGVLGRGGVGLVHRGHDQDLGRDVAVKFLQAKYTGRQAVLHRFIEEAQIGGQLQHPGIVPVYELGTLRGRPFFTMKLVKGKTLAKRLGERAAPTADRRTFLGVFEAVCQTMAYAHARGVVHRDLKPANIMIGSFGEVQVVDWGMGKVLAQGGFADERRVGREDPWEPQVVATVRSAPEGSKSVVGTVMGTPAYMPPEQARGDVERMTERSDVFALGAILCEILTGDPPYTGADQEELLGMAAMAELDGAQARLARCGADPELIALAQRCLMPTPAARPRTAEVVAQAVHDHLAAVEARVHTARVAAAEANVRAAALRRTQRLGIALIVAIGAGLAVSLWFWRDAEQQRGLAETNLGNFNRLSDVVRLEAAKARERELYPAWPAQAAAMRAWLAGDVRDLRAALPTLESTLAVLEARARPQSAAEREAERREHPRAEELAEARRQLEALRRAAAVRAGGSPPELVALADQEVPADDVELNRMAWALVKPGRVAFGREARGLALARAQLARVPPDSERRAQALDTLAWALHANGLDGEAIRRSAAALAAAGDVQRELYEGHHQRLKAAIAAAAGQAERRRVVADVEALTALVARRWDFEFEDPADEFLHATLRTLADELADFAEQEVARVEQRLAWAEGVEALTIGRFRERWREARRAIALADGVTASERYAAVPIDLLPQMGLVPIGMNPTTKLWEFYHLRSAWDPEGDVAAKDLAPPVHDPETRRGPSDTAGIVFVLVPGGTLLMGSQDTDPTGANFDPQRKADEYLHEVTVPPFFLARHELTRAQWERLSGDADPSLNHQGARAPHDPGVISAAHPVEGVGWGDCDALLRRHGLALPEESQWEHACRAGTSTRWWTGDDAASLTGAANLADGRAIEKFPRWGRAEGVLDDGWIGTAPVGSYRANPFGLFDMHGNVFEWCADLYRPGSDSPARVLRGGSFRDVPAFVRSACRYKLPPLSKSVMFGVRAARRLQP